MLATAALLIIGWYLTHLLLTSLDRSVEGGLISEHGGLLLILSGGIWALVGWQLMPVQMIQTLLSIFPGLYQYPYFPAIIGGALGLCWGMLVLFIADQDEATLLDVSGMYSLSESELVAGEGETFDLLTDSVILGTDVDT
ncbi:MAG: hypothetical protein R3A44_06240 [Caldilineaceae bacterium]